MIEHGLLLDGVPIPSTERVQRDPEAWWPAGHHSTRARVWPADLLVYHWTAGHPRDTGADLYRSMLARQSSARPGQPLDVAVQLAIGWSGAIWQLADLRTACVHVGDRRVIARSIGVECRWPGTRRQAERLGVEGAWATVRVDGQRVEVMLPSEAMLASAVWLAETLASLPPESGIAIPRRVPPSTRRFSRQEQAEHSGAQEHCHVPGSRKIDAAGLLVGELARAGWRSM